MSVAKPPSPHAPRRGAKMVYLIGADIADKPAGTRFRDLLHRPGILQMPGTHNGMAALQARDAGFSALYLSGAAMTASMGLPDLGIITIEEVTFFIRQVARASGPPVLRPFTSRTSCFRKNAAISTTRSWRTRATWQPRSPPPQRRGGISI